MNLTFNWSRILGYFCLPIFFISCHSNDKETNEVEQPIQFVTNTVTAEIKDPLNSDAIFSIQLNYPKIKSNDSSLINTILLQETNWVINKSALSDSIFSNPELVVSELETAYRAFKKDFPEIESEWYFKRDLNVVFMNDVYLTIEAKESSFLGGAHTNELISYRSYDLNSGRSVLLSNLLSQEEYERAKELAELNFLKQKGLKKGDDLKANGWFFPQGTFTLTNNFFLTDSTLIFHYNTYDISSYAQGVTKIELNMQDIRKEEA